MKALESIGLNNCYRWLDFGGALHYCAAWRGVYAGFGNFQLKHEFHILVFGGGPVVLCFCYFARLLGMGAVQEEEDGMDLKAVELSDGALRGIGHVLTHREKARVPAGEEFTYTQTNRDIGLVGPCSSGSLECSPRPKCLRKMERHIRTVEVLTALDGDAVVCVAPPQEPAAGKLAEITAVKVRRGESFVMEKGAWHWIPFPTGRRPVRFMVIFRNATGEDDLHLVDLPDSVTVKG